MDAAVAAWWALLLLASAANIAGYALLLRGGRRPASPYATALTALAAPVVLQCAWRSAFPSLYLQRFAFWDTPLNSILVDRTLACVGELSWNGALALTFFHVDGELTGGSARVRALAIAMFAVYVAAECTSYYNTATTNELYAAIEVALDAASQVLLLPAAVRLAFAVPKAKRGSAAFIFLAIFSVFAVVYPVYNFFVDCPMYMRRYAADEARQKAYLPFIEGLRDAATRRVPTQRLADWREDMSWMVAYFTFNPLAATLLAASAPSLETTCPLPWCSRRRRKAQPLLAQP